MKRSTRADLARQTVEICDRGSYVASDGRAVSLAPIIKNAVAGTRLYSPDDLVQNGPLPPDHATSISVTDETTIAATRRLAGLPGGHLACLNFASAKNPGGGFLGGSEAQEESLARSSSLYPCLLAAPQYYEQNRGSRSALYLDLAIWSPQVPFFRDDEGALLAEPFQVSVITAPAPNAGAVANNEPALLSEVPLTLQRRAAFVLQIAVDQQVRRLVLGAWGCGVFRNDPNLVARTFATLLAQNSPFSSHFDEVLFAIYDRSAGRDVVRTFQRALS